MTPLNLDILDNFLGSPRHESIQWVYDNTSIPNPEADVMRLMDPLEVVEHTRSVRKYCGNLSSDVVLLWTDDNSNYAGLFFRGELQPRVTLIDHEEPEDTPQFFSAKSFEEARKAGIHSGQPWYKFTPDYPVETTDYPLCDIDRELSHKYLVSYKSCPDERQQHAFYALNLLPPDESSLISELLWSKDMWIQERACRVIGQRRNATGAKDLYEVAIRGSHNGRTAAIMALKKIGTSQARELLDSLRRELGASFEPYFR